MRTCSFRTLRSHLLQSILFQPLTFLVEDAHFVFTPPICCFFISKVHIPLAKNYPAEVCPFSREVTFKPLSPSLQGGIRFLRNPLPAYHSAFLTGGLTCSKKNRRHTGLPSYVQVTHDRLRTRPSTRRTASV